MKLLLVAQDGTLLESWSKMQEWDFEKAFAQTDFCESLRKAIDRNRDNDSGKA